jgi:hypothetical protein
MEVARILNSGQKAIGFAAVTLAVAATLLWAPTGRAVSGGGSAPVNLTSPSISGSAEVGQTLTCAPGTWLNDPTAYAYQWNRDGGALVGATDAAHVASDADVSHLLTCTVTASNTDGDSSATSGGVIVSGAPAGGSPPPAPGGSPPAPVPAPAPAPTPVPTLVPLPGASKVISLPSARRCASRRRFRIRIRQVSGLRYVSAAVFVNGKRVKIVKSARLAAPVDLRGLPAGRFSAKIVVKIDDGRKLTGKRRYRTCAGKRGGKRRHRL